MSRDMMPNFELLQPTKLADALSLLDSRGKDIWKMAGGNDSLDWFKDRVKRPKAVMDLGGIAELKGIRETADGIEIGALTTLTEVANSPVIKSKFKVLADAAHPCRQPADPQLRPRIGGNVSQDARCWYYRSGLNCYRAGGTTCYSDTPAGTEPGARHLRRLPLRRGQPVGYRAGADRARGEHGDQNRQGRAHRRGGEVLRRPGRRHHPHDGGEAGRTAGRDPHPQQMGQREVLFREGRRPEHLGLPAGERRLGAQGRRTARSRRPASPAAGSRPCRAT